MRFTFAACLTSLLLASCDIDIPQGVLDCEVDRDCPPGWSCREANQACYKAQTDDSFATRPDASSDPGGYSPAAGSDCNADCYEGPPSTRNRGECRPGVARCDSDEVQTCDGQVLPSDETCDGRDDDCDGRSDEGCPCDQGAELDCYTATRDTVGRGICRSGKQICRAGLWGECRGEVTPAVERCDNPDRDDDCNGVVDDIPQRGDSCSDETAGDRCQTGVLGCRDGQPDLSCITVAEATAEQCNALDDDCDGRTDEAFDLARDPAHCGSCDHVCKTGRSCCAGACQSAEPPPDLGATCGGHCGPAGTIQCDGSCSNPDPPNVGRRCGSCGGTIDCDGRCSVPTPSELGQPCGDCGGVIQCDGRCDKAAPPELGKSCGKCGGTVQCNGQCSETDPANLGQVCGHCGGHISCEGQCDQPTPSNFGEACGHCGGTIDCSGSCTHPDPPNYGMVCEDGTVLDCETTTCPCVIFCESLGDYVPCKTRCPISPCARPSCPALPP